MHDESSIDYKAMIHQMSTGQEFIYENFGVVPDIGWQMESNGNSISTPSLLSMHGIDKMVISQIGEHSKKQMSDNRQLNFAWEGHKVSEDMSKYRVFTHSTAKGFKLDFPYQFHSREEFNWDSPYIKFFYSKTFFDKIIGPNIDTYDYTEDIAILYGGANFYTDARLTYYWIDNYMAEIQRLVRNYTDFKYLTYKFSTMEEYLDQINKVYKEKGYKFPYYNGDFLPYEIENTKKGFLAKSTEQYGNVTDLYSSNGFIREEISSLFHQFSILSSIFTIDHLTKKLYDKKQSNKLSKFSEFLKIKQNTARMFSHDVINDDFKNSKFFVDYNSTIHSTKDEITELLVNKTLHTLETKFKQEPSSLPDIDGSQHLKFFLDKEISKELYPVIIFNPSMQERTEIVNLTIEALQAAVFDENLDSVSSQIVPYSTFDFFSRNSRVLKDNFTRFLHFEVALKPMETKIYFVRHIYDEADWSQEYKKFWAKVSKEIDLKDNNDADLFNEKLKVSLNEIFLPKFIQNYEKMEDGTELIVNLYQYIPNFNGKPQTFNDLSDPQKVRIKLLKAIMHKEDLLTQVQIFGTIDSSKYQKDADQIELLVSLTKGSKFPVISAKLRLNNPKIIALRVEVPSMLGSSTKVYMSDSMFFTERKFKNEYSIYPAVDGAALAKGKDVFWTKNSHTLGCKNLDKLYEWILDNSLGMENNSKISTVNIAFGKSMQSSFLTDVSEADQVINQPISLTKVTSLNMTVQGFINKYSTEMDFMLSKWISSSVELISFDTKKNGDVFIKLRNRSKERIKIPALIFVSRYIKISGKERFLLNGLKKKDDHFKFEKEYFPTKTNDRLLKSTKENVKTLEESLAKQESTRDDLVGKRVEMESELIFLDPYEIATFLIEY